MECINKNLVCENRLCGDATQFVPLDKYNFLLEKYKILYSTVSRIACKEIEPNAGLYEFMCEATLARIKEEVK